jgi:DNA-binding NtrC family response regulator
MSAQNFIAQDAGKLQRDIRGMRVFIAEDEFLVALALEDDLLSHGCTIVGPFTRLDDAKRAAALEEIDIALLDINMNGQMAYPVADEFLSRGIPFIFMSGYGTSALPEAYRNTPRIPKPYDPGMLMKEIRRLIG